MARPEVIHITKEGEGNTELPIHLQGKQGACKEKNHSKVERKETLRGRGPEHDMREQAKQTEEDEWNPYEMGQFVSFGSMILLVILVINHEGRRRECCHALSLAKGGALSKAASSRQETGEFKEAGILVDKVLCAVSDPLS
jgi:hypothetical protein